MKFKTGEPRTGAELGRAIVSGIVLIVQLLAPIGE